ncbi:MAG TPA: TetR family transcriptional regulator [Acidimicrobiales bacterium]|nr:TetR family transcriptional regulator [Acidimicrobiales bacterium]
MPLASPRQRLLDAVVEHALVAGIGDQSLRAIAGAVGTSHRMLIHHFGSREGLLVEVTRSVEARQRELLAELMASSDDPLHAARRLWAGLVDPGLAPHERLFFELYGQALQGRPSARTLLDGIIDAWTVPVAELLTRTGVGMQAALIDARLMVAVTRGLLLDLLATGDRPAVEAAMERFGELYERAQATAP